MVTCHRLLLTALTMTIGLLGMGSRGLHLSDLGSPTEAVGYESPLQHTLQDEVKCNSSLESNALGDKCCNATPTNVQDNLEKRKTTTPFNITREELSAPHTGKFQVSCIRSVFRAFPFPRLTIFKG